MMPGNTYTIWPLRVGACRGELRVLAQLAIFMFAEIRTQQHRVRAGAQQRDDLLVMQIT